MKKEILNIYKELIKKGFKKLQAYKLKLSESPNTLSFGSQGIVFITSDNKIMKITNDVNEANSSSIFIKSPSKYVNTFYNVIKVDFKKRNKDIKNIYYLILQKKLKSPPSIIQDAVDDLAYAEEFWYKITGSYEINSFNMFKDYVLSVRDKKFDKYPFLNDKKIINEFYTMIWKIDLKTLFKVVEWFVNVRKDLNKRGIKEFEDYHSENIMMDGNNIKLIDLGRSKTSSQKIDVIESK